MARNEQSPAAGPTRPSVTTRSLAIQKWSCGRRLHPSPPKLCNKEKERENAASVSSTDSTARRERRKEDTAIAVGNPGDLGERRAVEEHGRERRRHREHRHETPLRRRGHGSCSASSSPVLFCCASRASTASGLAAPALRCLGGCGAAS